MDEAFVGIFVKIVYSDVHLVQIELNCSNGCFAGRANVYAEHTALAQFGRDLSDFPANSSDSREFEFGTFDPSFGGGGARLSFKCIDSAGHACVRIDLRSAPEDSQDYASETASFCLSLEANDIDGFARGLQWLPMQTERTVYLQGEVWP